MREDESRHGNVPNFDDPCEIAGQHIRAARHTRADCPITHAAERAERDGDRMDTPLDAVRGALMAYRGAGAVRSGDAFADAIERILERVGR